MLQRSAARGRASTNGRLNELAPTLSEPPRALVEDPGRGTPEIVPRLFQVAATNRQPLLARMPKVAGVRDRTATVDTARRSYLWH